MSLLSDLVNFNLSDTTDKIIAEYIWIGGSGIDLRSKARTLNGPVSDPKSLPKWNYDGSSTGQAPGKDSEVILYPQAIFRDPFRRGNNILVMCDAYTPQGEPIPTNKRHNAEEIFSHPDVASEETWYGIEQEYTLLQKDVNWPLGWPVGAFPGPQGPYYCGIGADKAFGRDIVDSHYKACLYAGINISGINGEVMPGQWEFQVGPSSGISAADEIWIARYILEGLRQGDPVSPLIFTICMDYLTRLIAFATARWPFHYHPLCKGIKLTHLMFADDLLMFCKGDAPSILLLMRAFTSFSQASGLQMNNTKSEIFFNGMTEELQQDILSVTGFQKGTMPFRYLGVPIQPGKISKTDCNCLVEKMVMRIRNLGAKKLSYAGRVVLINSVLNTLYNYWAAMFVIPKAAIKRVEAICRNFLWDSSTEYHRVPLVGWDKITMTKSAGGLGIKKASTWNIASVGKLVNWIYTKSDRLWIKWVDSIYLKGTDWHEYTPANDATWTWKTICKVKEQLKSGFTNGCWTPHQKGYTIGNGYDWLSGTAPKQSWATVAWNDWNVPKHSFISWLILQEGLNIKSKLYAYGYCSDDSCILCDEHPETIDHLFMECSFSCKVRGYIVDWIARPIPTVNEMLADNSKTMKWKALAMIFNTYRYYVWYHRNQARVQLSVMRPAIVAERMKTMMQQRLRNLVKTSDGQDELRLRNQLGFDF